MNQTEFLKKMKIGLVQINNSFSGASYFPYTVGLLQAYIEEHAKFSECYEFLPFIYSRIPVEEGVNRLLSANIVGFSTYVWNFRLSLEIARRLKKQKPEILIVFGGPQVPDEAEVFLSQFPFIDIVCHGEGEQVFCSIVESYPSKDWGDIPSISYFDDNGAFINHPQAPRIKDLDIIPSPYLNGLFEALMLENPQNEWLSLWETNRGCPFSCTFCDWGSATASKVYRFELERLLAEIDWFADRKVEFVFCCDANFGILSRDTQIAQYAADIKSRTGYPQALSVQNTKNATDRAYETQRILNTSGLSKGVDLALQSIDKNTLESVKRANISIETYEILQQRFTSDGVATFTDIILGLPGETYESYVEGVSKLIENGQHNRIQFNNLSILPNAEMGDPKYRQKHGMVTVPSEIINIHGLRTTSEDDVAEVQELVIATQDMPKEDWVKTRAFSWMIALLHFDKLLQIPLILIHQVCGISFRQLTELFMREGINGDTIPEINSFFTEKAKDIQSGGFEFCNSPDWLDIWWPADEYMFIKLCRENKLDIFYQEARELLKLFLDSQFIDFPTDLLDQSIMLNRELVKLPFQEEDTYITTSYNIWEFFQSVLVGKPILLDEVGCTYHINRAGFSWSSWKKWYREVVWYGNKKGAYLYGNDQIERQYAGHY